MGTNSQRGSPSGCEGGTAVFASMRSIAEESVFPGFSNVLIRSVRLWDTAVDSRAALSASPALAWTVMSTVSGSLIASTREANSPGVVSRSRSVTTGSRTDSLPTIPT